MLESEGVGFGKGSEKVTVLAYADDLVFLSDLWIGMSRNLAILEAFGNLTGLSQHGKVSWVHDSGWKESRKDQLFVPLGQWEVKPFTWWDLGRL